MVLLIAHGILTWGEGAGEILLSSSFFPVLVGVFIPSYFLPVCTTYGKIYLSWIYVIFSLCYAFKPILQSSWDCAPQRAMCSFCVYLQRLLLLSSVGTPGGPHEDPPPWQTLADTCVSHCSHFSKSSCLVLPSARHQSWLWPPSDSVISAAKLAGPPVSPLGPPALLSHCQTFVGLGWGFFCWWRWW